MVVLTPAERRGALVVLLLLALGAGHDLWRAAHPRETRGLAPAEQARVAPPDSVPAAGASGALRPSTAGSSRPILDLNRASAEELDRLPGVGPVLAGRIVEHRRLHGPFRSVDELQAVRGIGPRLYERLRPWLRIS